MPSAAAALPAPAGQPAVVVIDDNPDHLELATLALEGVCPPGSVLAFNESAQAIDWLLGRGLHAGRDTREQPRLVVVDLKMTQLDGVEVLRLLRAHPATAGVPVVVHSSSLEAEDVQRSYAAGASGYQRKANGLDELREAMRRLCAFWLYRSPGQTLA